MDENMTRILRLRMERTAEALRKNGFYAVLCENSAQALGRIKEMIPDHADVCVGGSMTLFECGALELLRSGKYTFYDRYADGLSREDIEEIFRKAFSCDTYLASANAVTEDGKIYNVDGNGNRVAAMIYGPRSVILIVGCNKIVENLDEARARVRCIAAPANAARLKLDTPCTVTGKCMDCRSEKRICAAETVLSFCKPKERIKVILVGEELGY